MSNERWPKAADPTAGAPGKVASGDQPKDRVAGHGTNWGKRAIPLPCEIGGFKGTSFVRMPNLAMLGGGRITNLIDQLPPEEREWGKVAYLIADPGYVMFMRELTRASAAQLVSWSAQFAGDVRFRQEFGQRLAMLERDNDTPYGDVRFNSVSLYLLARAARPDVIVETGVASGKSSAILLLALAHNGGGNLVSVDLPNLEGSVLADGSSTHTAGRPVGWLVPEFLRANWQLELGNSVELLPKLLRDHKSVDVFLHDSLHTYEHAYAEFSLVRPYLSPRALVLCDDIDLECGQAFVDFLGELGRAGVGYRELGGARLEPEQ